MHSLRRSPARSTTPLAGGCDSVRLWTWAIPLPRWEKGAVPETTVSSPRHLWHVAETTPALIHHRSPSAPNPCAGSLCLRYATAPRALEVAKERERERDCVYSGGHKRAKKKGGEERSWTILVTLQGVIGEAVHWETVTWNATHLLATMLDGGGFRGPPPAATLAPLGRHWLGGWRRGGARRTGRHWQELTLRRAPHPVTVLVAGEVRAPVTRDGADEDTAELARWGGGSGRLRPARLLTVLFVASLS